MIEEAEKRFRDVRKQVPLYMQKEAEDKIKMM
jgi:hypothetical protein